MTHAQLLQPHYASMDLPMNKLANLTTQIRFSLELASSNLSKYLMLRHAQDQNESLFYHYIRHNIKDSLPYIYTPSVGDACMKYSYLNFAPCGLYFSYRTGESVSAVVNTMPDDIDVIVVTDGSRVLGLGDLGIGGMGISIGKLSLYTAVGGIPPERTLPVCIDVGTNNPELKQDPQYLGDKQDRVHDEAFYAYLDEIMQALSARWPQAIIQFEDFSNNHAYPLLTKYRHTYRCFNDDIQGTATVCAATIKRALLKAGKNPATSRVFIVGGGSAGCGIANLINGCFDFTDGNGVFLVDRDGVIFDDFPHLSDVHQGLARPASERPNEVTCLTLQEAIAHYQPDVLVGVTGVAGLFNELIIKSMAKFTATPIIMPLSNPVTACEVTPQQVVDWIGHDAIVATGSPFSPIQTGERSKIISQCNNVYVFPGIGLGAKVVNAKAVSDAMLLKAVEALTNFHCDQCSEDEVLPAIESTLAVSKAIAIAVATQAIEEGLAESFLPLNRSELAAVVEQAFWNPDIESVIGLSFPTNTGVPTF
ncbi:oxaloacetate-decarboxylating malate dehydrogenase [Vibrio cincinnatiensis]|uniref:oxaloacetate-decarboxylating malate dehydrogenase n=1 Tax=Vibrio cincinnatiensis TaxID=675 RepID=UPI001EDF6DBB|nr:oxaloacetate-decarboxylating malate dehydrogenase [Vibrio cincinnatiensis]MCG3760844.1 oxaloacetate-decarboxylating malate dehydrogenase [Vibrio cincinnatiensis]MCG3764166.1 oxaloacetate-decarboxylating malate dehydrogenase [Vibrio cincinnatiensis]